MSTLTVNPAGVLTGRRSVVGPQRLASALWSDLGGSLAHRGWVTGIVFNLVLALAYLLVDPISATSTQDWAILMGSYVVVFVLADVATTNTLGLDAERVRRQLAVGVPLARILVIKNLTLLTVVGLPTLLATAALTLWSEGSSHLALTLSAVLFPIMTWLGLGNVISVLLPVRPATLRQRWADRIDRVGSLRWLATLALPYALCVLIDPLTDVPETIMNALASVGAFGSTLSVALVLIMSGAVWAALTQLALVVVRHRGVRLG